MAGDEILVIVDQFPAAVEGEKNLCHSISIELEDIFKRLIVFRLYVIVVMLSSTIIDFLLIEILARRTAVHRLAALDHGPVRRVHRHRHRAPHHRRAAIIVAINVPLILVRAARVAVNQRLHRKRPKIVQNHANAIGARWNARPNQKNDVVRPKNQKKKNGLDREHIHVHDLVLSRIVVRNASARQRQNLFAFILAD